MSDRWILHADMDAFYASIEQRDRPELRGQPVIVGANSERGVVAAASYEARQFGVRSAMPGFRAKELCPHGIFLPARMAHYASVSAEIHEVFLDFTSEIEPIALDEAFLDISGSLRLFGTPRELAVRLKASVLQRTQLNVSVGLSNSKLVAKIACTLGKPNGLQIVPPEAVLSFLEPLPVRRLWGVGPVLGERLAELGFRTLGDLQRASKDHLEAALGPRGPEIAALARGQDRRAVETDRAPKSFGEENTFERDISARDIVTAALTAHAEAVAARMRAEHYSGRTVTLKIKIGTARDRRRSRLPGENSEPNYPLLSRSRTLKQATDDASVLRETAITLWDEAAVREPVRLLGISVSNLETRRQEQLDLFAPRPKPALGPTLDAIHARFGKSAITRAVDAPLKVTPTSRRKRGDS